MGVVEGVDDGRCRLGIEGDVPFGGREGVAAIVEGSAHDEETAHQAGQFGLDGKGQGQVRRGSDDDADELPGVGTCRVGPGLRSACGGGRCRWGGKVRVTGPGGAVSEVGVFGFCRGHFDRIWGEVADGPSCGELASRVDGDVCAPGKFEPALNIGADLCCGHVAARGRDADDVDIVLAQQIPEGDGVVDSGITVEEQRQVWRHVPYSAGISSRCSSPPTHSHPVRARLCRASTYELATQIEDLCRRFVDAELLTQVDRLVGFEPCADGFPE